MLLIINQSAKAQVDTLSKFHVLDMVINGEDTILMDVLGEVVLSDYAPLDSASQRRYYILRKKVLKVYPYAFEASKLFLEINAKYATIDKKRKKKKYAKKQQKWIDETFGEELKKLKRSEGRILIKLIHRNLQVTSYELIKFYRGSFSAFWWQRLAKLYDADLKTEYHPEKWMDDKLIEMIIQNAIKDQIIEESKLSPFQRVKLKR
ncbi:MAG: DUF4294 domain-containing protein [Flavobacteriales bacterium]